MGFQLKEVRVQNLSKKYENRYVLKGVNATFLSGQTSLLLGQNGSGKSTLLSLLSTLLTPSKGEIFYDGLSLSQIQTAELRRILSFLAHEPRLYGEMTATENLQWFGRLYTLSKAEQKQNIQMLLDHFHLTAASHRLVSTFSRGMKQRLALARVFLTKPSFILLDEPYSHLDIFGKHALTSMLVESQQQGAVIVVATHEVEPILSFCNQSLILHQGQVQYCQLWTVGKANKSQILSLLMDQEINGRVSVENSTGAHK